MILEATIACWSLMWLKDLHYSLHDWAEGEAVRSRQDWEDLPEISNNLYIKFVTAFIRINKY